MSQPVSQPGSFHADIEDPVFWIDDQPSTDLTHLSDDPAGHYATPIAESVTTDAAWQGHRSVLEDYLAWR